MSDGIQEGSVTTRSRFIASFRVFSEDTSASCSEQVKGHEMCVFRCVRMDGDFCDVIFLLAKSGYRSLGDQNDQ